MKRVPQRTLGRRQVAVRDHAGSVATTLRTPPCLTARTRGDPFCQEFSGSTDEAVRSPVVRTPPGRRATRTAPVTFPPHLRTSASPCRAYGVRRTNDACCPPCSSVATLEPTNNSNGPLKQDDGQATSVLSYGRRSQAMTRHASCRAPVADSTRWPVEPVASQLARVRAPPSTYSEISGHGATAPVAGRMDRERHGPGARTVPAGTPGTESPSVHRLRRPAGMERGFVTSGESARKG